MPTTIPVEVSRGSLLAPAALRDAEVDDPGAGGGHVDVGRLEVPVHEAGRVNGVQALGQRGRQLVHRRRVERAVAP